MTEDSFFEDETSIEAEGKKKPKAKKFKKRISKRAVGKRPKKEKRYRKEEPSLGIVWVAVLVLFSFFLGFSLGMWIIPALTGDTTKMQQEQVAPPLTQEQLQEGLPEGHPPLEGQTPSGSATPSATPSGSAP